MKTHHCLIILIVLLTGCTAAQQAEWDNSPLKAQVDEGFKNVVTSVIRDTIAANLPGNRVEPGPLDIPGGSDVTSDDWKNWGGALLAAFLGGFVMKRPKTVASVLEASAQGISSGLSKMVNGVVGAENKLEPPKIAGDQHIEIPDSKPSSST